MEVLIKVPFEFLWRHDNIRINAHLEANKQNYLITLELIKKPINIIVIIVKKSPRSNRQKPLET